MTMVRLLCGIPFLAVCEGDLKKCKMKGQKESQDDCHEAGVGANHTFVESPLNALVSKALRSPC